MAKATIVMFSGELDKALAGFVIANGAAAAGWDVTMFFTFWGINIVRSSNKKTLEKKEFVEKMFESMMPRGPEKLKLSKMNMAGMGSSMIKKRMKEKRINSLADMMRDAKDLDVEMLVCDMSMDLMGMKKDEFVDEIDEIVGVGTYLKRSKDATVTLFI
jgi:peroxiredoxin family protein